ncbi:Phosphatidylglycerol/phosphatidylinositol transfer protein [Geranomyces variabilis]|uniref:Phosphatidylglycerol/phosphatidylinositol transfer protein n=1 Tax=Geranomyces variabilis TaxID=109894 RepID=A0AAD5TSA7_9FUNG|nr:Phosphatidylglycerol/phosphatidylinositol transfer protein [Geranomyces variabilis]
MTRSVIILLVAAAAFFSSLAAALSLQQVAVSRLQKDLLLQDSSSSSSFASSPIFVLGDTGSIENCGTEADLFHPESITLTPDPPRRGENLNVDIKGTLDETVDKGAYADVRVKLGLIKLVDTRLDLCDETKKIDRECPIEKGPLNVNTDVKIPGEIPPGNYQVHLDLTNFDGKHIGCFQAKFRL